MFGPYGISSAISQASRTVSRLQSGYLYHYAFSKYFCYIHWLMGYYRPSFISYFCNQYFYYMRGYQPPKKV